MKKHKLLYTFLFLLFHFFAFAQTKTEEFNAFKEKYSSKEFDYTALPKPKKEVDPVFLSKLIEGIMRFLSLLPWEIIFYFAVGLFLIFIAFRIYNNGGILKRNSKKLYDESDFDFIEENLTEVNLNLLIHKAESEQNYALAVRYLHYQNLQNLDKKGWIEWDSKKTNQQFINQIKDEKTRISFHQNTKIFNQVWFGEFPLDNEKYKELKTIFNQFNQSVAS
ncbi:hypothetical protein [Empedobacter brevis]|uniref:hypothetical protein n=1 Tax=Empedobacter brevis TaxID=247 RepID=UPI002FE0266A